MSQPVRSPAAPLPTPAASIAAAFASDPSRWSSLTFTTTASGRAVDAATTGRLSNVSTNTVHPRPSSPLAQANSPSPIITVTNPPFLASSISSPAIPRNRESDNEEDEEDDAVGPIHRQVSLPRPDKASRLLGIRHNKSMEPIPATSSRLSIKSTRSAPDHSAPPPPIPSANSLPLTSLYIVSGLPKSPQTWTLSDPDSVLGMHHSENAVNRWWRPEVLGSTVSPGAGGNIPKKKKKAGRSDELVKASSGPGALSKSEVGKMLSKALKLSFTREVEVVASTLQPPSTVHSFTFTLPAPATPYAPNASSNDLLRASVLSTGTSNSSLYPHDPNPRPSSSYLGPPVLNHAAAPPVAPGAESATAPITYHGVCLTVWSHADAERSAAIRRTLEANNSRVRRESSQSRLRSLRSGTSDPCLKARKSVKKNARSPWGGANGAVTDADTDIDIDTEAEGGAMSESDYEGGTIHDPGESTLFLPGDTVFWLPYALTLVSRYPVYDLMRDYLTLSWARFSKDVQSHTLQISKILSHPAPRAGELVRLDASPSKLPSGAYADEEGNLEVIARFPGGLDFGRGLVDVNFTMWPLFKCLNIDNILTICEIALAPTGRVLFFSRHPSLLGIAVMTIKYLVELRGWNGIALPAVHSRDIKIYIDDPGPWIIGLATETRYGIRPPPEVCLCDLDINYLSCPSPPPGAVSVKQQRDKYRQRLLTAFDQHYHPDHSVPTEFKEAFPAGRFRPICKIQAKRGASSTTVADPIKAPEWWHSTKIIQAFDAILQDKFKRPSLLKRISSFGTTKRAPRLTPAEQHIQLSIRKRATAFVDARDDLETKIGRLSRRLNFLMTESDLWRDKFVTFEQYAEKLSVEAGQLRTKVTKEQKETKRLTGLYSNTTAEKAKLETQLKDADSAHKKARAELEEMRLNMERMEEEREAMIAEVEAQIERALASMAVDIDIDEDDEYTSRPSSRLSSVSTLGGPAARAARNADTVKTRPMRSFSTESTLAESHHDGDIGDDTAKKTETINEEEEEPVASPTRKRFSATDIDTGMGAVDEGIAQKSDKIAQKVLDIQRKLETALASEKRSYHRSKRSIVTTQDSDEDLSEAASIPRRPRGAKKAHGPRGNGRSRSGTTSSVQGGSETALSVKVQQTPPATASPLSSREGGSATPTRATTNSNLDRSITPEPRKISSAASLSALNVASANRRLDSASEPVENTPTTPGLTPVVSGVTDDSDTDFQSAYSNSRLGSPDSTLRRNISLHDDAEQLNGKPIPSKKDTIIYRGLVHNDIQNLTSTMRAVDT